MLEIPTYYCDKVHTYCDREPFENFGDVLNTFILSFLDIKLVCDIKNPKLFAIGSILNNNFSENFKGVIWSSGCFNETQKLIKYKTFAVRWKLTLEKIENKENVVLGDGGLIISRLYKPEIF